MRSIPSPSILIHQPWKIRLFVTILRKLFSFFFFRRVQIAKNNIKRSDLLHHSLHSDDHAQHIVKESLNHLGLTLYAGLIKSFKPTTDSPKWTTVKGFSWSEKMLFLEEKGIVLQSEEKVKSLLLEKRGIIFLSAHIGAWEELIMLQSLIERPLSILSKRMSIQWTQRLWERSRRGGPVRIDRGPMGGRARQLIQALKKGECIGAVLDQHDPRSSAITCQVLGRQAATSPDLIRAALITNAIIVPVFMFRSLSNTNIRYELYVSSVIDPQSFIEHEISPSHLLCDLTQHCCLEIDKAIRMRPEQWMWIHRRWKLD